MRRFVSAVAIVLGGVGAVLAPATVASAGPGRGAPHHRVSGEVTGTGTLGPITSGCSFMPQVIDGTYTTSRGHRTGTVHLEGCTYLHYSDGENLYLSFYGTATVTTPAGRTNGGTATAPAGRTLTGSAQGLTTVPWDDDSATFDTTMSLTGPGGSITAHLTGTWQTPLAATAGAISGTLTSSRAASAPTVG